MALIACPECGKQISDATPSCPHCGYQFSTPNATIGPTPTKIGDVSVNCVTGIAMILVGIVALISTLLALFLFLPLGILICWTPAMFLVCGIQKVAGTRSIYCPHCGKPAELGKNFETYKCPTCKKRSVRDNDYLKPIL